MNQTMNTPVSNTPDFTNEIKVLADRLEMILTAGRAAVGFVVVSPETYDRAFDMIITIAADATGTAPEVVSDDDATRVQGKVQRVLNRGTHGNGNFRSISIVDMARLDYGNDREEPIISRTISGMNQGRNRLAQSALATIVIVPESHLSWYQEMPNLFSIRSFVSRFTVSSSDS